MPRYEGPLPTPANENEPPFKRGFDTEMPSLIQLSEYAGNSILDQEMVQMVLEDRPFNIAPERGLIGARRWLYEDLLFFKHECENPRTTQEEFNKRVANIIDLVKRSPEELRSLYGD